MRCGNVTLCLRGNDWIGSMDGLRTADWIYGFDKVDLFIPDWWLMAGYED